MVKIKYILIGVLIVILGILAAVIFFPNEEKRVKKQFNLLSEWVSRPPDENTFTLLQKMKNIGTLFDEHCELKAPSQSLQEIILGKRFPLMQAAPVHISPNSI